MLGVGLLARTKDVKQLQEAALVYHVALAKENVSATIPPAAGMVYHPDM